MADARTETKLPRSLQFALFAIGLLWLLAARVGADSAAQGIARLLRLEVLRPLLAQAFLVILLVTGFTVLHWLAARNGSVRETNALPERPSAPREWQTGAALGWALVLVLVLPMALVGDLHPQFWLQARAWGLLLLALLTLLLGSLATELGFRGFLYQRLIGAVGPSTATVVLAVVYAVASTPGANATHFSLPVSFLAGLLFALAYLRTHGLWLGWGLRFGWQAAMAVLLGLPLAGRIDYSSVVATDSSGALALTGGAYGPEGSAVAVVVLILGIFVLYRLTRDYAWQYTQPVIVAGGYPMEVAPPAAHTAMEAQAATARPALVQILGATPATASTMPAITEHLGGTRRDGGATMTEPTAVEGGVNADRGAEGLH